MQTHPISLATHATRSPYQCSPEAYSPSLTRTLMAGLIFGSNGAWLFLGFLAAQTYTYYTHSAARDPPLLRALVCGTIIITLAGSATEGFFVHNFVAAIWGNPGPLFVDQPWVSNVFSYIHPLFDALPAIVVQCFFTWRIWNFCIAAYGRKARFLIATICGFIILTSLCAFISALLLITISLLPAPVPGLANALTRQYFPRTSLAQVVFIWTTSTAVADVAITACMMAVLYHARSQACLRDTHDILSRLLRITLQTGLLTSFLAIPIGPLYFREHSGGEYVIPIFLLGKSYLISLLASLNARSPRLDPSSAEDDSTPDLSTLAFRSYSITGAINRGSENHL